MMTDIPLSVMMQGPAAVAAWLVENDKPAADRLVDRLVGHMEALTERMRPANQENIESLMAACAVMMATICMAERGGMRGPARDDLAEIIDAGFDMLEDMPEELQQQMERVGKLRAGR